MTKIVRTLSILTMFLILSCSSDDSPAPAPSSESEFTVNETDYSTPNGYIISATDGTHNSRHAIYLLNGTIINNEWYGQACDYSNNLTHGVIFNITSGSVSELAAGTYVYELNTTNPSLNETSIATSFAMSNNCITDTDAIDENEILSGSLTVQVAGDVYTLHYTFQTTNFGTVTGTYVGNLQLVQDLS